ncbi:hypothetical protein HMPREF0291_11867 [Corynebacterium genitalium ATCC 33030]|uniref:Uncharacterized protein n=1 Tax=Corynebacterium genitalium ATCC 33030 TaxID=585529 RepID=D7WDH9_9CORY|nr:hypothetical protein HMPREF0291_11867 [Corynebacterium genitalium ATCC 33030]
MFTSSSSPHAKSISRVPLLVTSAATETCFLPSKIGHFDLNDRRGIGQVCDTNGEIADCASETIAEFSARLLGCFPLSSGFLFGLFFALLGASGEA